MYMDSMRGYFIFEFSDASHHHKQVTLSYRWLGQAAENKLDFTVKLDQESINTMYIHNE